MSGSPGTQLARGANTALPLAGGDAGAVVLGLGWQLPATGGPAVAVEVDALLVLLDESGAVTGEDDVVFFSQVPAAASTSPPVAAGVGDADAEQVVLDLGAVPARVTRILVAAAIFAAAARRQTFAQVRDAYVHVADAATGDEIARHELQAGTGTETAMVFGELYRHARHWKFRAVGQGYTGGLAAVARDVGLRV